MVVEKRGDTIHLAQQKLKNRASHLAAFKKLFL